MLFEVEAQDKVEEFAYFRKVVCLLEKKQFFQLVRFLRKQGIQLQ